MDVSFGFCSGFADWILVGEYRGFQTRVLAVCNRIEHGRCELRTIELIKVVVSRIEHMVSLLSFVTLSNRNRSLRQIPSDKPRR